MYSKYIQFSQAAGGSRTEVSPGTVYRSCCGSPLEITVVSARGDTIGSRHDQNLDPSGQGHGFNENPGSIALLISYGNFQFYTAGDQTSDDWKHEPDTEISTVAAASLNPDGSDRVDLLKVSHHGSDTSTGKDFIDAISPKVSVISTKYTGNHKLPKKLTLFTLTDSGSDVLITGNGRGANDEFADSKNSADDDVALNLSKVFNEQGDVVISVYNSGELFRVRGNSYDRTFDTH